VRLGTTTSVSRRGPVARPRRISRAEPRAQASETVWRSCLVVSSPLGSEEPPDARVTCRGPPRERPSCPHLPSAPGGASDTLPPALLSSEEARARSGASACHRPLRSRRLFRPRPTPKGRSWPRPARRSLVESACEQLRSRESPKTSLKPSARASTPGTSTTIGLHQLRRASSKPKPCEVPRELAGVDRAALSPRRAPELLADGRALRAETTSRGSSIDIPKDAASCHRADPALKEL